MQRWRFYDLDTGVMLTRQFVGTRGVAAVNAPAGHGVLLDDGSVDPLSQRVDIETVPPDPLPTDDFGLPLPWYPPLVGYQPPAPDDTDLQTWAWDEEIERWVASPTLAALRLARWSQVKVQRAASEFGGFAWDGSAFDSDEMSQARIIGAVQMAVLAAAAEQPFAIDWTLQDNTVRTLSGADMIAVGLALGTHVATAHTIARALRDAIEAAATAEELEAIEWP
jgi:hypothetical protein